MTPLVPPPPSHLLGTRTKKTFVPLQPQTFAQTSAPQDKPLAGADPVIWYSFGVTHLPRLEDYPIMPVETVSFQLKPFGFFMWNPTLDIPPERNAASREEMGAGSVVSVPAAAARSRL